MRTDGPSTETVFFLGPCLSPCGREKGSGATREAVEEFIGYCEHQAAVARDYLRNGCDPRTHEWFGDETTMSMLVRSLDTLYEALYDRSCVGGPLHVVLDDGNLKDSDLNSASDPKISALWEDADSVVPTLCREIVQRLRCLTYPQRVVWWHSKDTDLVSSCARLMIVVRCAKVEVLNDFFTILDSAGNVLWKEPSC